MLIETWAPWILAVLVGLLGLLVVRGGLSQLFKGRWRGGVSRTLLGVLLAGAGVLIVLTTFNLMTYHYLTDEQHVAEVSFEESAPQTFIGTVRFADGDVRRLTLTGDDWQFDARVLKWEDPLPAFGLKSLYRPERISGRYRDVETELNAPRTAYDLSNNVGLDVWQYAQDHGWLRWVDAEYGSAAYVPMVDEGRYTVTMSTTGLVVRPGNEAAEQAIQDWQ